VICFVLLSGLSLLLTGVAAGPVSWVVRTSQPHWLAYSVQSGLDRRGWRSVRPRLVSSGYELTLVRVVGVALCSSEKTLGTFHNLSYIPAPETTHLGVASLLQPTDG
jgi:hypothetical protein